MGLICKKCDGDISLRVKAERWITMKCLCEITIIYFDGCIKTKTKQEYLDFKKKEMQRIKMGGNSGDL